MAHVTFIHGIANKPSPEVLLGEWERSLAAADGIDLATQGVTSTMVYWADVLYEAPASGDYESAVEVAPEEVPDVDLAWRAALSGAEAAWVATMAGRLDVDADVPGPDPAPAAGNLELERIPLPGFVKRGLMRILLRDVHHYLFDAHHEPRPGEAYLVQSEIRERVVAALVEADARPGPHVVVSHSMGTVIAYDCLKRVPECPPIDGLVTLGSPLGRDEIPEQLTPGWTKEDGFPSEKLGGKWINVFDHFDPVVGASPHLALTYQQEGREVVEDVNEQSWGSWRHGIDKYLSGTLARARLAEMLGL